MSKENKMAIPLVENLKDWSPRGGEYGPQGWTGRAKYPPTSWDVDLSDTDHQTIEVPVAREVVMAENTTIKVEPYRIPKGYTGEGARNPRAW